MWIITKDLLANGTSAGVCSRNCNVLNTPALRNRFRLLDADGMVYYEGLSDDADSQRAFAPLDDFGRGFAGCVTIEYFEQNRWQAL